MSRTLGPAQQLELDTTEQLAIILDYWMAPKCNRLMRLRYALALRTDDTPHDVAVALSWVQYVCARNLCIVGGTRIALDSSLGEIASALKDAK